MAYGGQSVSAATGESSNEPAAKIETAKDDGAQSGSQQDAGQSAVGTTNDGDADSKTSSEGSTSQKSETPTQGGVDTTVENSATDPAKAEQELETKENGKVPAVESNGEKVTSSSNQNRGGQDTDPNLTSAKTKGTTEEQKVTNEAPTQTLEAAEAGKVTANVKYGIALFAKAPEESKAVTTTDENSVTVTDAQGLINAIQNGLATTINIGADIDLGTKSTNQTHIETIKNYRDIVIKSADDNKKYAVDFNGYSFNMAGKNGVTFSNLDLYDRSYWSPIKNAKEYTFDNVNFHGSQLVYTDTSVPSVT